MQLTEDVLKLKWNAGETATFSQAFLYENDYASHARRRRALGAGCNVKLWHSRGQGEKRFNLTRVPRPTDDAGLKTALEALIRDGIVVLQDVPTEMDALVPTATLFGTVRRTFYTPRGHGIWDTAPKAAEAVNDTAYTSQALHPHTDATYYSYPPGLQAFCCQTQAAEGGRTIFVDGFQVRVGEGGT